MSEARRNSSSSRAAWTPFPRSASSPSLSFAWLGRDEEANAKLERLAEVDGKRQLYHYMRFQLCLGRGDRAEAVKELDELVRLVEDPDERLRLESAKFVVLGEMTSAREIRDRLAIKYEQDPRGALGLALLSNELGDVDGFFRWIQLAIQGRSFELRFLRLDPRLEAARRDPRYLELLRQFKFD